MTYLSTVLADAPTHYWRCADPGGVVANDLGSARPLPLFGIGSTASGTLGYSGPNAGGGSIVCTNLPWFETIAKLQAVFPISIDWVLWTPGPRADGAQCFPWGWADNGNGPYHNELATGIFAFNFGAGASVPVAAPTPNRWHHFAFTYAALAANFAYYIDGVLQPATTPSGVVAAWNDHLLLTRRLAAGQGYLGAISEFAIYNSVLTGAQVNAHFAAIDQQLQPPVYTQAGKFDLSAGTVAPLGQNVDDILNAVRKVYKNTP